jgi:hypothetical protein
LEAANRALKRLQKKLRDEELRMYMGDQDVDNDSDERRQSGVNGKKASRLETVKLLFRATVSISLESISAAKMLVTPATR